MVQILLAVFGTGGHVCLEQPSSAFSWQDPSVQDFLAETAAVCSVVPACCFGLSIHKKWLFASSLQDMSQLAGECNHASWEHENLVGKRDEWGGFRTQQSAVYPDGLCETIVQIIRPLFPRCAPPLDASVAYLNDCVPKKGASDPPHSFQDGAGIYSVPDWSVPPATAKPLPGDLRRSLLQWLSERRVPIRLQHHVRSCEDSPLFSTDEVGELRTIFAACFQSSFGITSVDWSVPPGQPYCLHALQCLSECLEDRDRSLWHCLLQGVPTGFDGDIPPSNVFLPALPTDDRSELAVCFGNWKGAEDSPALLQSLVQEEIDKGYLEEIESLSHAQQRWGDRVAVGRMNVVQAPGKAPRLIVDSSVCGTNGACYVPESYQLPLLESIRFSSPLRECSSVIGGFSLDIRAAHKTVRVRERDRGLLGVGLQNGDSYRFFFYKVCPFGATFSSHWFQRVSGFLVRFLHVLIWVRHMLMMYSDDLLMAQDEAVLPLMASLVLAAWAVFGYPISWKKLQLGPTVTWIGWELHFSSGSFCIPQDKLLRLEEMLQTLLRERHVKKKDLEKVIGVIQWMLQCHPILRPFLTPLYLDLNRPLGTLFSVNPGDWRSFCACVDEHAIFSSVPRGMAFSPGSRLLEARHVPISCNKDLLRVPVTSKRLWVRIADPSTSRRKLSKASVLFLQFWKQLSSGPPRLRALRHPPAWDVEAAADAHGSGPHLGIGGYFRVGTGPCFWFSEQWTVADFAFTRLELQSDAQRNICCYEALGQIALVHCLSAVTPGGRLFVRMLLGVITREQKVSTISCLLPIGL